MRQVEPSLSAISVEDLAREAVVGDPNTLTFSDGERVLYTPSPSGQRIAVIGTGSTGVQIVCALSRVAGRLIVFQRTAQWILPVPNLPYSGVTRRLFERLRQR